jgi:NAD(P)-dependent dehydrogenase (short-subunit alcohol dehydrogenase family)
MPSPVGHSGVTVNCVAPGAIASGGGWASWIWRFVIVLRQRLPYRVPEIDVHIVPSADAPTGMGEPGLPPLAPAFANAVARLTGKPLRDLPFNLA